MHKPLKEENYLKLGAEEDFREVCHKEKSEIPSVEKDWTGYWWPLSIGQAVPKLRGLTQLTEFLGVPVCAGVVECLLCAQQCLGNGKG